MAEAELSEQKQQARKMWAGGEYAEIAEKIAERRSHHGRGRGDRSGDKVLDVACGTGNATIPAAQTGARGHRARSDAASCSSGASAAAGRGGRRDRVG